MYRQQPSHLLGGELSIAQFLAKDKVLRALKQIEMGDCSEYLFEVVGEQWGLPIQLAKQLTDMGLPPLPD
ncbi:TPA: hypothetical protein PZ808_003114, partial [Staphylococcus aureus]|nr:hypothetical protein [Staphylococcus aureus]